MCGVSNCGFSTRGRIHIRPKYIEVYDSSHTPVAIQYISKTTLVTTELLSSWNKICDQRNSPTWALVLGEYFLNVKLFYFNGCIEICKLFIFRRIVLSSIQWLTISGCILWRKDKFIFYRYFDILPMLHLLNTRMLRSRVEERFISHWRTLKSIYVWSCKCCYIDSNHIVSMYTLM